MTNPSDPKQLKSGAWIFPCPKHPENHVTASLKAGVWKSFTQNCKCNGAIIGPILKRLEGTQPPELPAVRPRSTETDWRATVVKLASLFLDTDQEYQKPVPAALLLEPLLKDIKQILIVTHNDGPEGWTETQQAEEIERLAKDCLGKWAGGIDIDDALPALNGNGRNGVSTLSAPARSLIVWEDYDEAIIANQAYLQRQPVVENLFYTESISLIVGGKHAGKSTIARTAALCIAKGLPFLGRETLQGHVLYAASDDEVMTARMELLRMGWNAKKDPLALIHVKAEQGVVVEPQMVLDEIANRAREVKAVFIVLDMLFDYAGIRDEMSYAGTREAAGRIQILANQSGAHALATHHSPKHLPDIATAATAALGSQGIAARFSPIVLARHWGASLYTVESTAARDPRGVALPQTCVAVDENGRTRVEGPFKDWMKWQLYAPRIMGMIDGGEPGREYSVESVAREFEIPRPQAQNALYQLWKAGTLQREKKGRGFRYWKMIERSDLVQPELGESENSSWRGGND